MTETVWESAIDENPGYDNNNYRVDDTTEIPFLDFPDVPDASTVDPDLGQQPQELLKLAQKRRANGAAKYEEQVATGLRNVVGLTVSRQATVHDAATVILYGKQVSYAIGDLAAADEKVANMVDWFSKGTENPYLNVVNALAPMAMQIMRNHEQALEPKVRVGIKIPFTKLSIPLPKFKLGIRFGGAFKMATDNPDEVYTAVFSQQSVVDSLTKKGIRVAPPGRHRA